MKLKMGQVVYFENAIPDKTRGKKLFFFLLTVSVCKREQQPDQGDEVDDPNRSKVMKLWGGEHGSLELQCAPPQNLNLFSCLTFSTDEAAKQMRLLVCAFPYFTRAHLCCIVSFSLARYLRECTGILGA